MYLEFQDSQTLLMIEKKASLAKTQQIRDLEEKLKLTSTLSSGLYINTYSTMTLNMKGTDCDILSTYSKVGTASGSMCSGSVVCSIEKMHLDLLKDMKYFIYLPHCWQYQTTI